MSNNNDAGDDRKRRRIWPRLVVLLAAVVGLTAALKFLPIREYLGSFLEWVQALGIWGPIVVTAFYVIACVLFLPGSVLTLGIGFIFGLVKGTVIVSVGSTLGACAAFLVGRTVARGWVAQKVEGSERFAAIDRAVGKQGFKIVILTRLSPIFPFNLLNYAFGLTKVGFWHYALASWIGMIPGSIMYVYFGSGLGSLAEAVAGKYEGGTAQSVFFWIGLFVTVAVTLFVTRVARRALKETVEGDQANG